MPITGAIFKKVSKSPNPILTLSDGDIRKYIYTYNLYSRTKKTAPT